jgi:hypothetical protein
MFAPQLTTSNPSGSPTPSSGSAGSPPGGQSQAGPVDYYGQQGTAWNGQNPSYDKSLDQYLAQPITGDQLGRGLPPIAQIGEDISKVMRVVGGQYQPGDNLQTPEGIQTFFQSHPQVAQGYQQRLAAGRNNAALWNGLRDNKITNQQYNSKFQQSLGENGYTG